MPVRLILLIRLNIGVIGKPLWMQHWTSELYKLFSWLGEHVRFKLPKPIRYILMFNFNYEHEYCFDVTTVFVSSAAEKGEVVAGNRIISGDRIFLHWISICTLGSQFPVTYWVFSVIESRGVYKLDKRVWTPSQRPPSFI